MKCQATECKANAEVRCSVHQLKFCATHYVDHSFSCDNKPLRIDVTQELKREQISNLNKRIAQTKKQIVAFGNNLALSIKNSVKRILSSLDQQKAIVMDMIQLCKPETQITQILDIIPGSIWGDQNSLEDLFNLERKFKIEDFKVKAEVIVRKFYVVDATVTQAPILYVNPVFESLEKLDLEERIVWCKNENLFLIPDPWIREIKITKHDSFVFICIIDLVGET